MAKSLQFTALSFQQQTARESQVEPSGLSAVKKRSWESGRLRQLEFTRQVGEKASYTGRELLDVEGGP